MKLRSLHLLTITDNMKAAKYYCSHSHSHISSTSSSFTSFASQQFIFNRNRNGVIKVKLSDSDAKRANLSARKKERIRLPNYDETGGGKKMYRFNEFLSHPSGIEAMLNTRSLQSFQSLDSNMYRCTLPEIQFLNFGVAPVLDLQVIPTDEDCIVEMLSCKFDGSEVIKRQNDHFSASMRNHIMWETVDSGSFLEVDVKLNVALEIYTMPFTLLPTSAVEGPGNLVMQALVDRLVPLHVQQLLQNYDEWIRQQSEIVT